MDYLERRDSIMIMIGTDLGQVHVLVLHVQLETTPGMDDGTDGSDGSAETRVLTSGDQQATLASVSR